MSKLRYVALALAFLGNTLPWPVLAKSAAPVDVAVNRCNAQATNDAAGRVRDYDRHAPGKNSSALVTRYGALVEVITILNEEREILNNVCSSDAQKAPFFAQIAATSAWALVLQADLAARLNASCPAAAKALPTMMIADAWLALANVVNEGGGTVPTAFGEVIPKVQVHAQTFGLTLPPWGETSAYWRDQVHAKAKEQVATCPSPTPTPPSPQ
ncbi:MAG TPA: hypothetical protein VHT92_12160 [Candidatus Cybelea sp.]|jgi:hypothetical protein|nr:hypothetical protein [Candidatus Cybelea sp.]